MIKNNLYIDMSFFSINKNAMDSRLKEVGSRLEFFIEICYNGNMSAFKKECGISVATISAMKDGANATLRNLFILEDGGVNSAWLVAKGSPKELMFADNKVGDLLKGKYPDAAMPDYLNSAQKGRNVIYKAQEWILDNFNTVEKFVKDHAHKYKFTNNSINRILSLKDIPSFSFYDMLEDAGCTRKYLTSQESNQEDSSTANDQILNAIKPAIREVLQEMLPDLISDGYKKSE
jgi:hypothetical protein